MIIEIVGRFYNNHSLTIINRNIASKLAEKHDVYITALDSFDPEFKISKDDVKNIKKLERDLGETVPDIQVRHSYPPIWNWPKHEKTKIVYIQPWEYSKVPFEWQYKFETFADGLIVPSNYIADTFTKGGLNPEKVFVVPNGFNEEIFNRDKSETKPLLNIDPDRFNFVYVGNSQWRKGLDILLNTWKDCFKKYDKATLIIKDNSSVYGKNNVINEVIKMQYKTDCAEVIYIDDNLSEKDMANIYKLSDVVLHPYRAEGFAMHVQEAMACGCIPVVPAGGPTDDFIPKEHRFKLPTRLVPINVNDPNIFATKPGDAMTLMSSHTFVSEPSGQDLKNAIKYIYHHHNKQDLFDEFNKIKVDNTWTNVVDKYEGALNAVAYREGPVRHRFG